MAAKSSISITLGPAKSKPPIKPATLHHGKRPASHVASDDEASDDEHSRRGKVQLVSGIDAAGDAISADGTEKTETRPMIIPALKNRDWRAEVGAKRRTTKKAVYLPPEAIAQRNGEATETMEVDVAEEKFGLQVVSREASPVIAEQTQNGDATGKQEVAAPEKLKTEDEIALEALLANDARKPSTLVLDPLPANDWRSAANPEISETDAYRRDIATRPDVPSLDDYAAVPVEEFGAALLRGMGWKEGQQLGRRKGTEDKLRVVEKRPAFLGIGAKPREEIPELGAWGKGDRKKRKDTTYVPVVLVDKKTGKVVDPDAAHSKKSESDGERGVEKKPEKRSRSRERERERDREYRSKREGDRSYDSTDRRRRDRERSGDRERRDRDRGENRRDDSRRYDKDWRRGDSRDRRRRSSRDRAYDKYDKYDRHDRRDRDRDRDRR